MFEKRNLSAAWSSLYFHHIGKTAGTSYSRMLRSQFAKSRVFPHTGPSRALLDSKLASFAFFTGHFPLRFVELLPQPCLSFTTLRDPKSVVVSIYNHLMRLSGQHISFSHRIGRPLASFDDFLNDDILRKNATNSQVYSIGQQLSKPVFLAHLADIQFCNWQDPNSGDAKLLNELMYGAPDCERSNPVLLECAADRIENHFALVGIVEQNDETCDALRRISGLRLEQALPRKNVANGQKKTLADLSKAQLLTIDAMTSLDQQLYDRAKSNLAGLVKSPD